MCSCLHSHILRVPQAGPEFLCQVHILADEIDVLLEGLKDKICRVTGQTKEELQRELEMVEIEEVELPSDETTTAGAAEDVSRFFQEAQADPILNREDLLRAPILPPISRPPPSTTTTTITITTTVDDTDVLDFHTSTAKDPIVTLPEIHSPVLRPVARPRRGRFHRDFNRRRARAREQQLQQREQDDDDNEEGRQAGRAGRIIRVRLPGQGQQLQQQQEEEEEGDQEGRVIRVRLPGQERARRVRRL